MKEGSVQLLGKCREPRLVPPGAPCELIYMADVCLRAYCLGATIVRNISVEEEVEYIG